MAIKEDVFEAVKSVLKELESDVRFDEDTCLLDIMDSMSVLEVLLELEDKDYNIKYIVIDKVGTIKNLIDLLEE